VSNVLHFQAVEIGFTPRQVMQLTGVPYSTLNLWAKNGLVQPSVAPGTGTGSERVYSFSDLVALKVAFELRKSGVTTSSIKRVVEFLRENEHMNKPLSEARLVVRGRDVAMVREGELVSVLSKPGQSYLSFVVDLRRCSENLLTSPMRRKLLRMGSHRLQPLAQGVRSTRGPLTAANSTRPRTANRSIQGLRLRTHHIAFAVISVVKLSSGRVSCIGSTAFLHVLAK